MGYQPKSYRKFLATQTACKITVVNQSKEVWDVETMDTGTLLKELYWLGQKSYSLYAYEYDEHHEKIELITQEIVKRTTQ